jgi:hypothetical protein
VQLAEAAHGPERALGDGAEQVVPRQVEHFEHGVRGHTLGNVPMNILSERLSPRRPGSTARTTRSNALPAKLKPLQEELPRHGPEVPQFCSGPGVSGRQQARERRSSVRALSSCTEETRW